MLGRGTALAVAHLTWYESNLIERSIFFAASSTRLNRSRISSSDARTKASISANVRQRRAQPPPHSLPGTILARVRARVREIGRERSSRGITK